MLFRRSVGAIHALVIQIQNAYYGISTHPQFELEEFSYHIPSECESLAFDEDSECEDEW